jgi:hypothetical protein
MAELKLLGCYLVSYALFWLPASILVRSFLGHRVTQEYLLDLLAMVFALTVSYAGFWIYLLDAQLGLIASGFLLAWAAATIVFRRRIDPGPFSRHLSVPVRVAFLLGLLYLGGIALFGGQDRMPVQFVPGTRMDVPSCYFWLMPRAGDEMIPLKFADAVAHGGPLRGAMINFPDDWQFSDRPPLQSAVLLAFWPLIAVVPSAIFSQAIGTLLQVQWVVGLAALGAALGWGRNRPGFVLLVTAVSGCVYYNSTYVWPKLLAAALTMAAAAPLAAAWRRGRRLTGPEIALASSAAALGMLAHGSVAYSLIPVALMALGCRQFVNLRTVVPALLLAGALYLPWSAYQSCVDPPGDRCVRWMLANRTEADAPPLRQCLQEAYSGTTVPQWLAARARGLLYLVSCPELDRNLLRCVRGRFDPQYRPTEPFAPLYYCRPEHLGYNLRTVAALLRYGQVEQVFHALGLLNLAWPLLLWRLLRPTSLGRAGLGVLLLATLGSLGLWWLLMFEPQALIVRNSSMAMMLGLTIVAALLIYDLPPRWRWTIAGLHVASMAVLWVAFVPTEFARSFFPLDARIHLIPLAVSLGSAVGVTYYALWGRFGYRGDGGAVPQVGRRDLSLALAGAAIVSVLGLGAVARNAHLRELDRHGCITPHGIVLSASAQGGANLATLFDGVVNQPDSYGTWNFLDPLRVTFRSPQRLSQIRLHLYDFDNRFYRFRIEGLAGGQWRTLLDRSQGETRGAVDVPPGSEPLSGLRISGLYNSDQQSNPENKLLHAKELELVPAAASHP